MTWMAGIVWMPAFFLMGRSLQAAPSLDDLLSTPVAQKVSESEWAERRGYSSIADEGERLAKVRADMSFDYWLACRAEQSGRKLSQGRLQEAGQTRKQLEYHAALIALSRGFHPTEAEIKELDKQYGWTTPNPEQWEVSLIFLDDTNAKSEAGKEAVRKRTEEIRKQVTPENFEEMARLWSDSPSSAAGGHLGLLQLDRVGPTFASNVSQTPVGSIGGPYRTKSGWNILYVRSHEPERPKAASEHLQEVAAQAKANEGLRKAADDPAGWRKLLDSIGVTSDTLILGEITAYENYLLGREYVAGMAEAKGKPSAGDLRSIYEERKSEFTSPIRRRAREILVSSKDWTVEEGRENWEKRRSVRDRARGIRQRILDGADFGKVALEVSIADSATSGGELGWIQQPAGYVIDSTLAALKPREISPPMLIKRGYWLLQLLEIDDKAPVTFEQAQEMCGQVWLRNRIEETRSNLRKEFEQEVQRLPVNPSVQSKD